MSIVLLLRQLWCAHRFDLDDLIGRAHPEGNVTWACWKCEKVFKASCGLTILSYGQATKKPARPA